MSAPVARSWPRMTTPAGPDPIDASAAPRNSSLAWGSAYRASSPGAGNGVAAGVGLGVRLGAALVAPRFADRDVVDVTTGELARDPHAETNKATSTMARPDRRSSMPNLVVERQLIDVSQMS